MPAPLDIDVLRTFHTIVRLGQFRAASLQLNRSPSAVSSQIRRLEEQTGGRLFERDNQAVTLTPLGRRVLLETADLLQTHDRILAGLTGQPVVGEVRLGVAEDYAARLLKAVLPRLQGEHPGIVLEVLTGNSSQLRRWLGQGLLDLALLVGPPRTDRADGPSFGHTQPADPPGPTLACGGDQRRLFGIGSGGRTGPGGGHHRPGTHDPADARTDAGRRLSRVAGARVATGLATGRVQPRLRLSGRADRRGFPTLARRREV